MPKVSLAQAQKINDKISVRAFAGPETGMDCAGEPCGKAPGENATGEHFWSTDPTPRNCFFSSSKRPSLHGIVSGRI
jgi:hypothetical protein